MRKRALGKEPPLGRAVDNRVIGYIVLAWRFGRSPLVFVGRQYDDGAVYNACFVLPRDEGATLFTTRGQAKAAIRAAMKKNDLPEFACEYKVIPVRRVR